MLTYGKAKLSRGSIWQGECETTSVVANIFFFYERKGCEFDWIQCWLCFRESIGVDGKVDDCCECDGREGREHGKGHSKICACHDVVSHGSRVDGILFQ